MSNPSGHRINRRAHYVHVESTTVRDARISYRALGLLTYLLDQKEGWQVRSEQLTKGEGREGRDAVRKVLHELARHGYYRLERRRFRNGQCAMGTAVSEYPVEQWALDYQTFGEKLEVPVIEQEDGSFRVKYPDGTLGADAFNLAGAEDADPGAPEGDEPDQEPQPEPDDEPAPAAAAPRRAPRPRKSPEQKAAEAEAKKAAAEEKAAQEQALDEAADKVAKWWWEHAEKHLGKYAGQRGGFVAVRKMIRRALAVGYTQRDCAKALQHARRHFPAAQQWQDALGIVTNHIQPKQPSGRVPYSDSATWGTADTGPLPDSADLTPDPDDSDDVTFGVIARP